MKLSVILVNNNLCDLLRQTLNALVNAGNGIEYEVFIIDNASTDNSVEMIHNEFPQFQVLLNEERQGVAKSYNHAIQLSKGEYVLLVTPDTITGKETLNRVLDFMDIHTTTGGLGVRMLSPQGRFLPESNRGLTNA